MFQVDISDETADSLFRDILVQDYRGLQDQIKELQSRSETLPEWEAEDLAANLRWVSAIRTLFEYYLPHDQAQKIINEKID
jgi:predicted alpha/beta hydrolase